MDSGKMKQRIEDLYERVSLLEKRLDCIQTTARSLGDSLNLDNVLHTVAEQVTEMLDAERATVFLVDDETKNLLARVIIGPELRELVLQQGQGVAGWVAETGKTLIVKDAYKDKRFDPTFDNMSGFRTRSILCQPMVTYRGKIVGVIQVLNKQKGYFALEDQDLLSTITTQATISIENSKYYMQSQEANYRLREAQENLRRNYQRLEILYRIQADMTQTWERENLLKAVVKQLLSAIPCEAGAIMLSEPGPPILHFMRRDDGDVQIVKPAMVGGILGRVIETGSAGPGVGDAGDAGPILHPQIDVDVNNAIGETLARSDGEVLGAVVLANRRKLLDFNAEDAQLLKIVARQISIAAERVDQHDELTKANNLALIGQALSGVLHDLKSPMSVISGYAQLMEAEDDPAKRSEYAMTVLNQFKAVSQMTQEVLAFARGEAQILKRNVYLAKFLAETEELLAQEFAGHNIVLKVENEFREKLKVDEGKLRRIVFNLARNARDAMPQGGTFTIASRDDGDSVLFTFADTGHGIAEEIQDRLFQSFVSVGKKDGTGLGLAIVKKIVDQHGGTIEYETAPEKGTRFTISLPKE